MRPEKRVGIRRSYRVLHYWELFSLYSGDQLRPVGQPRWCPEGCTGNAKPEWATVGTNNKGQLGSALFTPIVILNSNSTIQLPFSLDSVAVTEPLSCAPCKLKPLPMLFPGSHFPHWESHLFFSAYPQLLHPVRQRPCR